MYELKRDDGEINELLNEALEAREAEATKFRGLTYEEGIESAVLWLTGQTDEYPMAD